MKMNWKLRRLISVVIAFMLILLGGLPARAANEGAKETGEIRVGRIEMQDRLTVRVGQTRIIPVYLSPHNADSKALEWISSDDEVVLIAGDGVVAGISPGTAVITVIAASGAKAYCTVTVPDKMLTGIALDPDVKDFFSISENGGKWLTAFELRPAVEKAVKDAKKGETAVVSYKNKQRVSAAALRAAEYAAQAASFGVSLRFHTMDEKGAVQGQIRIDAALAKGAENELKLAVYTSSAKTTSYKNALSSVYGDRLEVIYCEQQGTFGMAVAIAAKVDLSRFDQSDLYFYSYHPGTGDIRLIEDISYFVDPKDYLHLYTDMGGVIVVTDTRFPGK